MSNIIRQLPFGTRGCQRYNICYIYGGGVEGERASARVRGMIVTMVSEGNGDTNQAFLLRSIPIYSGIVTKCFCYWKHVLGGSWMARTQESFM